MAPRYSLAELIGMIDGDNGKKCRQILEGHLSRFVNTPGSVHNHQNWRGGYWDHIVEVMNMAVLLYHADPRPFQFTLSSALLALFLHDIEKPWKYEADPDGQLRHKKNFDTEEGSHSFRNEFINHYGIVLSDNEENALKYVHGEGADYSPRKRVMGPLAAFCHICDVWVARIRFDCPMEQNDPWPGAKRVVS